MKVFLKILNAAVSVLLVLVIGSAAILAFTARRSPDAIPTVAGLKVLTVLSGSMEPAIHTGDVILVRPLRAEEIVKEGDVITFWANESTSLLITHRIVGTVKVNDRTAAYVTKGDANQTEDLSTVALERVLGRVRGRVPYFGYISHYLHTPVGIVLAVILPGLVLVAGEFRKIIRVINQESRKPADSETRERP